MKVTPELTERAKQNTKEFSDQLDEILKTKPDAKYDDILHTHLIFKISELELKVEALTPKLEDFIPDNSAHYLDCKGK